MKMTKICGGIAVAVSLFAMTQTASAGCLDPADGKALNRANLVEEIAAEGTRIRCQDYPANGYEGTWDKNNPIWAWKRTGDGCQVHYSLGKQFNETAQDTANSKRGARGAANDLADGKDDSAAAHLQNVMDTIMYSARLASEDMEDEAQSFSDSAYALQQCISLLTD
jgi:hypothetical protein